MGARGEPQSGGDAGASVGTTWGGSPARLPPTTLTPTLHATLVLRRPMSSLPSWLRTANPWSHDRAASPSIPGSGVNSSQCGQIPRGVHGGGTGGGENGWPPAKGHKGRRGGGKQAAGRGARRPPLCSPRPVSVEGPGLASEAGCHFVPAVHCQ